MGKKKTTTTQNQNQSFQNQNTFAQVKPEDTQDIQAFRAWNPQSDPNIPYRAASAHERLHSSLINPIGGYYSPNTREAIQRSGDRQIDQDASMASRSGQYDINNQRMSQLASLAGLTAPHIVQSGSSGSGTMSGTGTQVQSGDLLGQLIGGASQIGSAALL